jgi:hypothetical protein
MAYPPFLLSLPLPSPPFVLIVDPYQVIWERGGGINITRIWSYFCYDCFVLALSIKILFLNIYLFVILFYFI